MTITSNTHLLFPTASQSVSVPKTSSPVKFQDLNTPSFAQILKKQIPSTYPPPETGTYTRSAKATEAREWVLDTAAKDPEKAKMWTELYAYNSLNGPRIDATDQPILRIAATGEVYTDRMRSYYGKVRQAMQAGRSELYESEIAKCTPHVEILHKIFAYNDALPEEFRRIADW
jgi:hypothetical protein